MKFKYKGKDREAVPIGYDPSNQTMVSIDVSSFVSNEVEADLNYIRETYLDMLYEAGYGKFIRQFKVSEIE